MFLITTMFLPWPFLDHAFVLPEPLIDLALTLPWTCPDLVLTLPWHCSDLALTLPWPCLTLPQPCFYLASSLHWPCLDIALTLLWPYLDLALTLPSKFWPNWISNRMLPGQMSPWQLGSGRGAWLSLALLHSNHWAWCCTVHSIFWSKLHSKHHSRKRKKEIIRERDLVPAKEGWRRIGEESSREEKIERKKKDEYYQE